MNIIDQLKNALPPELLANVARSVGESESGVGSALSSIYPLLLGGILKKSSEPGASNAMDNIVGLLKQTPSVDELTSRPASLLGALQGDGGEGSLVGRFLPLILGSKSQDGVSFISQLAGIKPNSVTALFNMAIPVVMGSLKKMMGTDLSEGKLTSLLQSQKDNIAGVMPAGLGSMLGVASFNKQNIQNTAKKGMSWLPRIIGLVILLAIGLFVWKSCSKEDMMTSAPTPEAASTTVMDTVRAGWEHLGEFFAVKLPSGVELNVPEYGVENKLITFITDPNMKVDDSSWFSFDRLVFEKGSATLKKDSDEQLNNIAEILKAYPTVTIKLGGYTDNTGSQEGNLQLSQQRADSVRSKLVNLGIGADRIVAKGYGSEHPVVANDTEQNRAKNRRIDLLVTHK